MAEPSGLYTAGGVNTDSRQELREQAFDIKNMLPIYIFTGMEYASYIQSAIPFGQKVNRRHVLEFYRHFWHIYHYVKNSVDAEKLNSDLVRRINKWFELYNKCSYNQETIIVGIQLFLEFVKNMQEWGIGQLFQKGIDPPFMNEDIIDFDILLEELDEEVVTDQELFGNDEEEQEDNQQEE